MQLTLQLINDDKANYFEHISWIRCSFEDIRLINVPFVVEPMKRGQES